MAVCANIREKIKQECKKDVECNLPLFANKKDMNIYNIFVTCVNLAKWI